jgi:hypothetical protein
LSLSYQEKRGGILIGGILIGGILIGGILIGGILIGGIEIFYLIISSTSSLCVYP